MQAPIFALNQPANQPAGSFYEAVMLSCSTCPLCQVGSKDWSTKLFHEAASPSQYRRLFHEAIPPDRLGRPLPQTASLGCFTNPVHPVDSPICSGKPVHWTVSRSRSTKQVYKVVSSHPFARLVGKPLHQAVPLGHSAHPLRETAPQSRPTMLPTESFCQVSLAGRSAKPPYKEAPRKCDHATSSRSRLLRCHFARYLQNAFSPTLACTHLYYRGNE